MLERIPGRERVDILVAWLAISVAFALALTYEGRTLNNFLIVLGISLVTAGIGFAVHEMAHKFTAMKYGYWAEFHKENLMLLVAVVLAALAGVVFAAPGATYIFGNTTRDENGRISAAGPVSNLLLCIPFAAMVFLAGGIADPRGLTGAIGLIGLKVNGMFAAFNMLPVSVLDGRKILAWNPVVFIILIVAGFGVVIGTYYPLLF